MDRQPNPWLFLEILKKTGRTMTDYLDLVCMIGPVLEERYRDYPDMKGRHGFAPCILGTNDELMVHELLGIVEDDAKAEKYMAFALEKATRLLEHPEHNLSWQSRDEAAGKWPGAIRADLAPVIISISGYPPLIDEALAILSGELLGLVSHQHALNLLRINQNGRYDELLEHEFFSALAA